MLHSYISVLHGVGMGKPTGLGEVFQLVEILNAAQYTIAFIHVR